MFHGLISIGFFDGADPRRKRGRRPKQLKPPMTAVMIAITWAITIYGIFT